MSFKKFKDNIEYGDSVLLHIGYDNMLPIVVKRGETYQTKFGAVRHDKLVGKAFGTRFQCPRGWIYLLHPTPELWTISLPHRTQILYSTDISMILFQLDLKPGSIVVEAGTGSGSLSHSLLRTVMPQGHLHTFEFHEERSMKAREEFTLHGLAEFVTVTHRDVCGDGFQLDHVADAVFLDLPKPWDCMLSAKNALRREGGRLCSFSPCIEQVQRSCEELVKLGFTEITTLECLARNYNIQFAKLQNIDFGDTPDSSGDGGGDAAPTTTDSVTKTGDVVSTGESVGESKDSNPDEPPSKVMKLDAEKSQSGNGKEEKAPAKSDKSSQHCFTTAVPAVGMPGHTGFLTFATLPVQKVTQ